MSAATAATPNFADRLAKVCVGLRPELEVSRHVFRRSPAYLLRDPITFQTHHLNETDYCIVAALTPERSLKKVFEQLVEGRGVVVAWTTRSGRERSRTDAGTVRWTGSSGSGWCSRHTAAAVVWLSTPRPSA